MPETKSSTKPRPPLSRRCHVCGYRYESTLAECPFDKVALGKARTGAEYLGQYRLVERLAVGGMGSVYRAVYEKAGRPVAVKLLHQSLRNEVVSVSRFFTEARAVNTIRHPNVVEVYDLCADGEDVYMVLELLRGKDLRTLLGEQPNGCLPPARTVAILEQMCGALQATHDRNIVHRDLKPENIFLTNRNGEADFVKLLDFGVAKMQRPEGRLTREGIALGTPEYMAPEQARGADVDGRTDIYAVGCIAFEMLTGRTVFGGDAPGDVMIKQVREAPPSPRQLNPEIPERLEAVVLRCLAKSPKNRPASAFDLAHELNSAIGGAVDATGALMSWKGWDGPSSTSQIDMPMVQVNRPTRAWLPKHLGRFNLGAQTVRLVLASLAAVIAIVWFAARSGRPVDVPAATASEKNQPVIVPVIQSLPSAPPAQIALPNSDARATKVPAERSKRSRASRVPGRAARPGRTAGR